MAISDPPFGVALADGGPDDLPRTLRRERDARQRQAREKEAREKEARERETRDRTLSEAVATNHLYDAAVPTPISADPPEVAVHRLDIPFFHLMRFFLKAVFAAVPALIVLAGMIWLGMQAVQIYFPDLVKMQVLILFPPN
jgi:hypothetical protein